MPVDVVGAKNPVDIVGTKYWLILLATARGERLVVTGGY